MSQNWVLLRGLTREQLHWGDFIENFERQMGVKAHTFDFPGVGLFHKDVSPNSIERISHHVFDQIVERGLQKFSIIGHSLGAMVSAAILQQYPRRINHAVFVNTSFANVSPWFHRLQIQNVSKMTRAFVDYTDILEREKIIFDLTTNIHRDRSVIEQWVEIQKKHPVSKKTFLNQILAGSRFKYRKTPNAKVLLLASLQDRFVSSECSLNIAKYLGAPFKLHPQAGHDLTTDDPQWVIDQIQQWTSGQDL